MTLAAFGGQLSEVIRPELWHESNLSLVNIKCSHANLNARRDPGHLTQYGKKYHGFASTSCRE